MKYHYEFFFFFFHKRNKKIKEVGDAMAGEQVTWPKGIVEKLYLFRLYLYERVFY